MGLYDTFFTKDEDEIQLKNGLCKLNEYHIGEEVPLKDGVYVDYGGIVVIVGGKFVATFPYITDKWGGEFGPRVLLSGRRGLVGEDFDEAVEHEL